MTVAILPVPQRTLFTSARLDRSADLFVSSSRKAIPRFSVVASEAGWEETRQIEIFSNHAPSAVRSFSERLDR
jgi:hypothetical protein